MQVPDCSACYDWMNHNDSYPATACFGPSRMRGSMHCPPCGWTQSRRRKACNKN